MAKDTKKYPVSLEIDYPKQLSRETTFFRLLLALPILVVLAVLTGGNSKEVMDVAGQEVRVTSAGITGSLFAAVGLMIIFRQRYPKWWYNFLLELQRFSTRVGAYLLLLTDKYPSTEDQQSVHLEIKYPDVKKDLNRWLPLVKWFLAIPHYFVLFFLVLAAFVVTIIAWVMIMITGEYPKNLFDFVVGVTRWSLRVQAYAFLLTTDEYPPFSLK